MYKRANNLVILLTYKYFETINVLAPPVKDEQGAAGGKDETSSFSQQG